MMFDEVDQQVERLGGQGNRLAVPEQDSLRRIQAETPKS